MHSYLILSYHCSIPLFSEAITQDVSMDLSPDSCTPEVGEPSVQKTA